MAKDKKRKDPEPVPDPPGKRTYECGKCGTPYETLGEALACGCRSGGQS